MNLGSTAAQHHSDKRQSTGPHSTGALTDKLPESTLTTRNKQRTMSDQIRLYIRLTWWPIIFQLSVISILVFTIVADSDDKRLSYMSPIFLMLVLLAFEPQERSTYRAYSLSSHIWLIHKSVSTLIMIAVQALGIGIGWYVSGIGPLLLLTCIGATSILLLKLGYAVAKRHETPQQESPTKSTHESFMMEGRERNIWKRLKPNRGQDIPGDRELRRDLLIRPALRSIGGVWLAMIVGWLIMLVLKGEVFFSALWAMVFAIGFTTESIAPQAASWLTFNGTRRELIRITTPLSLIHVLPSLVVCMALAVFGEKPQQVATSSYWFGVIIVALTIAFFIATFQVTQLIVKNMLVHALRIGLVAAVPTLTVLVLGENFHRSTLWLLPFLIASLGGWLWACWWTRRQLNAGRRIT